MPKNQDDGTVELSSGYLLRTPLLTPAIRTLVRSLNRDFVALAGRTAGSGALPVPIFAGLAAAPGEVHDAIANCPYVLFQLPLEVLGRVAEPPPPTLDAGLGDAWRSFVQSAWILAWHLSRLTPLGARMVLGVAHAQVLQLAALAPGDLQRCVAMHAGPLLPRWHDNPCFWSDLLRFAGGTDPQRLAAARLLGLQLLAADLRSLQD